jgi:site-specific DNA-methyltransferase (adenine-specific)
MSELPDGSIQLMVTSPPYNAGKEYDLDLSLEEYLGLLERVMRETYRVLSTGGRACVNVANLGRKPYIPLHAYLVQLMQGLGYQMRGEIIWNKASTAGPSSAWGSWRSATNPVLRDVHEYILVFCKGSFARDGRGKRNSIGRDEFLSWTKSDWSMPTVSARQVGHPAPFPEELPRRLIELLSFVGDTVLDPFCGSGTTCLAASALGRHYVGYDIHPEYLYLAQERLARQA